MEKLEFHTPFLSTLLKGRENRIPHARLHLPENGAFLSETMRKTQRMAVPAAKLGFAHFPVLRTPASAASRRNLRGAMTEQPLAQIFTIQRIELVGMQKDAIGKESPQAGQTSIHQNVESREGQVDTQLLSDFARFSQAPSSRNRLIAMAGSAAAWISAFVSSLSR